MNGIWFAAMVALLMAAGVAAQLGWQPPLVTLINRSARPHAKRSEPEPAAVAERR
ncbi:hypothetical protein [Mycolicibacterium sp. XJ1819]